MFNSKLIEVVVLLSGVIMTIPEIAKGTAFTSVKYLFIVFICRKSTKKPWN